MTTQMPFGQNGQQPDASGLNAQQPAQQMALDPAVLRYLAPEVFGEPLRESCYEDAVFAGSIRRGGELEIGTFSIMVLVPDATHPNAEMVVRTNGGVTTDPNRLKKIGDAFLRWAKDPELLQAFEEASQKESGAMNEAVMMQAAKGGGLG